MSEPPVIERVSLVVRDLDRVRRFYAEVVGLAELEADGERAVLGAGGAPLLELLRRPDAVPDDRREAGLFHAAFLLPDREALGRWLARGDPLDGAADHLVSEAVYLHDPEGNGVEIYADRPADTWRWDGGRVAMANAPLDAPGLLALADGPATRAPDGTRIGHVHLRVGAVDAAREFYAGALGLDVTAGWGAGWGQALFLSRDGYHHHLAVNTWSSAGAGPRNPERAGLRAVTMRGARTETLRDPWGTTIHVHSSRGVTR